MKLVVGLGNPGKNYEKTRHNIGFDVIDRFKDKYNLNFIKNSKFNAMEATCFINFEKVIFVKPLSFMNLSGDVVLRYINFYNISSTDILIIQDDLDMEVGKIRILFDSSSGGHNGIKDITLKIGTKEYTRLKIGISNNKVIDTKDYVLGRFTQEERKILEKSYEKLYNLVEDFINLDVLSLKQIYNSLNN